MARYRHDKGIFSTEFLKATLVRTLWGYLSTEGPVMPTLATRGTPAAPALPPASPKPTRGPRLKISLLGSSSLKTKCWKARPYVMKKRSILSAGCRVSPPAGEKLRSRGRSVLFPGLRGTPDSARCRLWSSPCDHRWFSVGSLKSRDLKRTQTLVLASTEPGWQGRRSCRPLSAVKCLQEVSPCSTQKASPSPAKY